MADFTKRFNDSKNIVDTHHGKLPLSEYIKTLPEYDASKQKYIILDSEEAYNKNTAHPFIQDSDHSRTGNIKEDLVNQFSLGVNSYPCYLENATNMVMNDKNYVNNSDHPGKKINNKIKYPEK